MRLHLRHRPLLLSLVLSGCSSDGCMKTEAHVDVPVTLDAVKKLGHPPDVVVAVERVEATSGGGACGHSAVCLILVPVLVYEALFPTKWDEATARRGNKVLYSARFETNGSFIESTQYQPEKVRYFGSLVLRKLGRRVIVQTAEASVTPAGVAGDPKRVPIFPQAALIAEYDAALDKEKDAEDRAALIVEAATWLGVESVPFLEKHEKDEHEPDVVRALVIDGVCATRDERRDAALSAAREKPGPKTAAAALRCASSVENGKSSKGDTPFFVEVVAGQVCRSTTSAELRELSDSLPRGDATLATAAERCTRPPARTLLRVRADQRLPSAELASAMRDPGPYAEVLSAYLGMSRQEERSALFAGLGAHPGLEQIVKLAAQAELTPTSDELRALVKSYAYDGPLFDGSRRAEILGLFQRANEAKVETSAARRDLDEMVSAAKESDRAVLRAAMMVLGDRQQAAAASRGLDHRSYEPHFTVTLDSEVIGTAFTLSGCSAAEIKTACAEASKLKDSARGALCAK